MLQGVAPERAGELGRRVRGFITLTEQITKHQIHALIHPSNGPATTNLVLSHPFHFKPSQEKKPRLLVLLSTLALLPAALLFRGPIGWRLALGAVLVCNPIAVR